MVHKRNDNGGLPLDTALISGAAQRLGRAAAHALSDAGLNIIIHYLSSGQEARLLKDEIEAKGVKAWILQGDLASSQGAEELARRASRLECRWDILINNASVFPENNFWDVTEEDILRNIKINAGSPFVLSRAFARQCGTGAIVNFLDSGINALDPNHYAYQLSKRMLFTLTRDMSLMFAPRVRVNAIAPGLILPPAGKGREYLDALTHTNPLQTTGSVEEITDSLLFLLNSRFITGQVIFVDGGRHLLGSAYEA